MRLSDIGYDGFKCQLNTFLFEFTAAQRIVTLALCVLYKYSCLLVDMFVFACVFHILIILFQSCF